MTSPRFPGRATTAQRAPHGGRRRGRAIAALLVGGALTLAGCAGTSEPGATGSATTPHATSSTAATTPTQSASASAPATAVPSTIATPADGATIPAGVVEVTGTGTAFEGTLSWQILAADTGNIITHGFTTAGANGEVGRSRSPST